VQPKGGEERPQDRRLEKSGENLLHVGGVSVFAGGKNIFLDEAGSSEVIKNSQNLLNKNDLYDESNGEGWGGGGSGNPRVKLCAE